MTADTHTGLVLGVDGGNSKTIALVARCDGIIVGAARGGNTDIYGAGSSDVALTALDSVVDAALEAAGAGIAEIEAAAFSMAGADWPEDMTLLEAALSSRGFGGAIVVVNDALGALRAGSVDGSGVSVVCGTGGAVGARGLDGRAWHASWWQEPQGSRHLADKTVWAVYRAELGMGPSTSLTRRLLQIFEQETVEGILHAHTARLGPRPDRHGQVTRALLREAEGGDRMALGIVCQHGAALGDYAVIGARKVGIEAEPFILVLTGGVFRHESRVLANAVIDQVRASCPKVRPVFSRFEPAVGAVLLAFDWLGVSIDDQVVARLIGTLPPETLFAT